MVSLDLNWEGGFDYLNLFPNDIPVSPHDVFDDLSTVDGRSFCNSLRGSF